MIRERSQIAICVTTIIFFALTVFAVVFIGKGGLPRGVAKAETVLLAMIAVWAIATVLAAIVMILDPWLRVGRFVGIISLLISITATAICWWALNQSLAAA